MSVEAAGVRRWLAAAGWLLAAAAASGQLGDAPGERQEPIVPAGHIPPAPVLSPEEALRSFKVAAGYRLEVVATEPLVQDPVAIAFGPDERMWVVEMRGFMPDLDGQGEDAPVGRVVVLQDRDDDGRYDTSQVFVDGLILPRTVMPAYDGVLVGAPPELAWWRDSDGDGRADAKEVLATDYGVKIDPTRPYFANPELAPNGLLWALDNGIYSAAYTKKFRRVHGRWESAPTSFRGQWGLSQDDWGRFYHNSNADQLRVDIIPAEYLRRSPHGAELAGANVRATTDQRVWPGRVTPGVNRGYQPGVLDERGRLRHFTAACAPWVYRGGLLPGLQGSVFVAEPAANLVRRNVLSEEDGSVVARNAYPESEFITSTDERFRPVNFATGPEGALYIVDFHRGVLQHRLSLTTYLRQQSHARGLVEPRHLGRIYRVVHADRPTPRRTPVVAASAKEWISRLADPNAWRRETAQRLLVESPDPRNVPAIREHLGREPAVGRIHALWTLHGLGAIEPADVRAGTRDADPRVRAAAVRVSEPLLDGGRRGEVLARLLACTRDDAPQVRLQAVLTLGNARDGDIDGALADAVMANPGQLHLREALLSGVGGREIGLLARLRERSARGGPGTETAAVRRGEERLARGLAAAVLGSREPAAIEDVLELAASGRTPAHFARAVLGGMSEAAERERRPVTLSREPPAWESLARLAPGHEPWAALKGKLTWPGKPGATAAGVAPLSALERELFETGRILFTGVCAGCHQANGRGLDGLAPPLLDSEWVLGNPQRLIRVLLHGLTGPIKVRRQQYTGDMPAFGQVLDDAQLAAVLTYLRREWGHDAAPIAPARVTAERRATAGHAGPWSQEELRVRSASDQPEE